MNKRKPKSKRQKSHFNDLVKQHNDLVMKIRILVNKDTAQGEALANRILAKKDEIEKYKKDHPMIFPPKQTKEN